MHQPSYIYEHSVNKNKNLQEKSNLNRTKFILYLKKKNIIKYYKKKKDKIL